MTQHRRLFRRTLVLAGAALAAALVTPALADDPTEVAGLFTQSVTQGNWDVGGYQAFSAMAKKYGFKETHIEAASYEKAPAILRIARLARRQAHHLPLVGLRGRHPGGRPAVPEHPVRALQLCGLRATA